MVDSAMEERTEAFALALVIAVRDCARLVPDCAVVGRVVTVAELWLLMELRVPVEREDEDGGPGKRPKCGRP